MKGSTHILSKAIHHICIQLFVRHHPNEVSWKTPAINNNVSQESRELMLWFSGDVFHTAY